MGNTHKVPIICPSTLLEKYNNGSIWRSINSSFTTAPSRPINLDGIPMKEVYIFLFPFLTSNDTNLFADLFALIFIITVLLLNRKKWVQRYCLYLFINYFLTFLFLRTLSRFVPYLHQVLWNIAKYHFAWCVKEAYYNGTVIQIRYAHDPNENMEWSAPIFNEAFDLFDKNSDAAKHAHNYISATFLIIHRLTIYCACTHPLVFKKHFSAPRLHFYYCVTGCTWTLFAYIYDFLLNDYDLLLVGFFSQYITVVIGLFHVIFTILSIRVVIKFNKSHNGDIQDIKNFIAFSIYPVTFSIFDMFVGGASNGTVVGYTDLNTFTIRMICYGLLNIFYSMSTIISLLLFIPIYRKTFFMLIRRNHSPTISPLMH